VVTAELELTSPAHFGGELGGVGPADLVVQRDPRSGAPLLTGASLAGALRSHLADVLVGYFGDEDGRCAELFGGFRGDDEGDRSPLIVFDSIASTEVRTEIRDGVRIDPGTGTAEDHAKFDVEVVPAGVRFPLRVELLVEEKADEADLVELLATALNGLARGDIRLGRRKSRGFGMCQARNWRAVRYDLRAQHGWRAWLASDHERPIDASVPACDEVVEAFRRAEGGISPRRLEDKRRCVRIDAQFEVDGPLLVGSPGVSEDGPDVAHLTSAGRPVLPGSGLVGALRNRARRIALLVVGNASLAEPIVVNLFGSASGEDDGLSRASRIRVTESVIEEGCAERPTRVRLDRFTGGVASGALFDEERWRGGKVRVTIDILEPDRDEIGLVLLLVKDLLSGDLPLGGNAAVGYGRLVGTACVRLEDGREVELSPGMPPSDPEIDDYIRALWDGSGRGRPS
jgi:CRISPR/Cas system CSM-associated protein Csm3 (group 7 of RAMP superfamily)